MFEDEIEVENADMWSFIRTDSEGNTRATNFHAETWPSALQEFVNFLKGNGFSVDKESVGIDDERHHVDECWDGVCFSDLKESTEKSSKNGENDAFGEYTKQLEQLINNLETLGKPTNGQ